MADLDENRKKVLKEVIARLHAGASPSEVKEKFKQVLEGVSSEDIARIEQELVREGLPRDELFKLCDVHLAVFRDQLEKQPLQIPLGHPINILMEEHKVLQQHAERLGIIADVIASASDTAHIGDALTELQHIVQDFQDAEKHYLREENALFPIIEKHGITEPPAIMWMEHNQIRERKKQLIDLTEKRNSMNFIDFKQQLNDAAKPLCEILPSHFYKENNILYPAALQVVTDEEWQEIRGEFEEIGYCSFTPQSLIEKSKAERLEKQKVEAPSTPEGILRFETGTLSREEVETILNTLPVDITFVDKDDTVRFFNKGEGRIFVRTKAVIGRKVQQCHPQKSIDIVNKIVESFKKGEKDVAEFWITMNNRLIHIRFFAVRGKDKEYLGALEVVQDITDIKKIEGEKRLLDWKG